MLKQFFKLIGAIAALILAPIAVYVVQDWVKSLINPKPLDITVVGFPWHDFDYTPPGDSIPEPYKNPKTLSQIDANIAAARRHIAAIKDDQNRPEGHAAFIRIENNTSTTIKDVVIDLRRLEHVSVTARVLKEEGERQYPLQKSVKQISVPDLKPGDVREVYAWSNFEIISAYSVRNIRVHSSAGGFKANIVDSDKARYEEQPDQLEWLDGFSLWMLGTYVAIVAAAIFYQVYRYISYLNKLLRSEEAYRSEKARYEGAPSKFTPNLGISVPSPNNDGLNQDEASSSALPS